MKKKIVSLLLAAATMASLTVSPVTVKAAAVKLVADGVVVSAEPVIVGATALVPAKALADQIGATTNWDSTKRLLTITTTAHKMVFSAGSKNYTADGSIKTAGAAAQVLSGAVMVPADAVASVIGAKVTYDEKAGVVTFSYFSNLTGTLKIDGSTTLQPVAQTAADKLNAMNKGLSVSVAGGGSGTGIKDAAAGTVNIGMSSRDLTEDELKSLTAYAVANDGIAIIVNPANKVKNLTKQQAIDIFSGNIKNWKDVGGANAPIILCTRETGSGTRATFEELLLDKKSVAERAAPYTSSTLILRAVAGDKNAIGFDSIGFVDGTVKTLSLEDVDPTVKNITDGKYPLGRKLYCATKGGATGLTAVFIDYLKSADIQNNVVVKENFIKLK